MTVNVSLDVYNPTITVNGGMFASAETNISQWRIFCNQWIRLIFLIEYLQSLIDV